MAKQREQQGVLVQLDFHVPEDIVSRYATNIVVQYTGSEFIVSFFEAKPPILLGSPEENLETMRLLGRIRADCVARVVVAPEHMQEFLKVIKEQVTKNLPMRTTTE